MRFRLVDCQTAFRKQGLLFEVVDSTHPSDGGPVAISFHTNREDAETICNALNLANRL